MNESDERWERDRVQRRWRMPTSSRWKRLPGIRLIRFVWHSYRLVRHQAAFSGLGMWSSGYDEWVLYGIARGFDKEEP